MHYIANVEVLFNTIEHVTQTVTDRWLNKNTLHSNGTSLFLFVSILILHEVFTTVPLNILQIGFHELLS